MKKTWDRDTILVTGSRDFRDVQLIHREVEMCAKELFLMANHPLAMPSTFAPRVVHGGCPTGADSIATSVARTLGFELKVYPVDHALDGPWPAAGPRRNQRMLDLESERIGIVLAFTSAPDGQLTRGTADCVRRALAMKLPVRAGPVWIRTHPPSA